MLARNRRLDLVAATTTRLRVGTPTSRLHDVEIVERGSRRDAPASNSDLVGRL
jgi:hypothetical protein